MLQSHASHNLKCSLYYTSTFAPQNLQLYKHRMSIRSCHTFSFWEALHLSKQAQIEWSRVKVQQTLHLKWLSQLHWSWLQKLRALVNVNTTHLWKHIAVPNEVVEFSCCSLLVAFRCYWVHSLNTVGFLQHCNRRFDPTLFTPTHFIPSKLWPWALDFCINQLFPSPLARGFLNSVGTVSRDNSGLRPNWAWTVTCAVCTAKGWRPAKYACVRQDLAWILSPLSWPQPLHSLRAFWRKVALPIKNIYIYISILSP